MVLRLHPWRARADGGWDLRVDPALLLGAAAASFLLQLWMTRYWLPGGLVMTSDFHEYCGSIAALVADQPSLFSDQRSRLPAVLPAALTPAIGLLDSLLVSAQLASAVIGAGLFLWGRALHGRLAGVLAAVFAASSADLVGMSRTLSFYPQMTAAFTLAAGLVACALRWRNPWTLALAGLGVGACLLVDLRGLIWALPLGGAALVAACWKPWHTVWRRLLALLVPIALSFALGQLAYAERTVPLEQQVSVEDRLREVGLAPLPRALPESAFVWGWTSPFAVPTTVWRLVEERRQVPSWEVLSPVMWAGRTLRVDPWLAVGGVSLVLAVAGLWRWPLLVFGLAATLLPFLASLRSAVTLLSSMARYVGQSAPGLALLMGLAWAIVAQGGLARGGTAPTHSWRQRGWLVAAGLAALLVVLGVVPSYLSPHAPWRVRTIASVPDGYHSLVCRLRQAQGEDVTCMGGNPRNVLPCRDQLMSDLAQGRTRLSAPLWP